MKTIVLAGLLMMAFFASNAQKINSENIPVAVSQSFKKLYPDIIQVKWELEEGNYEVKFKKNDETKEVIFNNEGRLIQKEWELKSVNDLPKEIISSLNKEYHGYHFENAEKIETMDGKTLYEVDAEMNKVKYELVYDEKGIFVRKEEKKERKHKGKRK